MIIFAFGINHKSAPVELRERIAFSDAQVSSATQSLVASGLAKEVVILSTCNRTEIYCAAPALPSAVALENWLASFHGIDAGDVTDYMFLYPSQPAAQQLMRVASGLDSMILGETQILGQLKTAYAKAVELKVISQSLSRLFEKGFSVAKRVRTDTAIGQSSVSVAAAAVVLAKQLFGELNQSNVLMIGAGRTGELASKHLRQAGVGELMIANRSFEAAESLAQKVDGRPALLDDVPDLLVSSDIVFSSTASTLPILGKGAVERALKKRKHRPIFMVDLAVPRDIEQEVGELEDIFLYTVDDLKDITDQSIEDRKAAAAEGELIVDRGVEEFISAQREVVTVDAVKQFRQHAESLQAQELEKALSALRAGTDAEQALNQLARGLTNKLLHHPTVSVRRHAADNNMEAQTWLLELFGLNGDQES